jgi:outer membrane protein OmpA-like peptidoglycan-associated protein
MRAHARRRIIEDEEESSFVSMTDMTVSFLFIVMILLAFFASQLHPKDVVPKAKYDHAVEEWNKYERLSEDLQKQVEALRAIIVQLNLDLGHKEDQLKAAKDEIAALQQALEKLKQDPLKDYLRDVELQRSALLNQLQKQLKSDFPDLQVIVSAEMDALRFKGDGLFPFSSSELSPLKREIVEAIADRLKKILPCYTLGPQSRWTETCNPVGAVIEAVQIEGHTDSDGPDNTNLTLSTERANATFFAMTARQRDLTGFRNTLDQPVLSVAGYGKMRPVADNSSPEGKATNRRIDLRIIMYTPRSLDDIENVKAELRKSVQGSAAP